MTILAPDTTDMYRIIQIFKPVAGYFLVLWIILIILFSSLPKLPDINIKTDNFSLRIDYIIHLLEYGSLTFFTILTFAPAEVKLVARKVLIVFISLLLFAMADEFHQLIIPGRTFNPVDLLFNALGIIGGTIITVLTGRRGERREAKGK
ncbi:MAG: VanZ family protein [Bacteroidales bacterium]|nr:VanZ family protein [Bacteroidales bacterium]